MGALLKLTVNSKEQNDPIWNYILDRQVENRNDDQILLNHKNEGGVAAAPRFNQFYCREIWPGVVLDSRHYKNSWI